MNKTNLKNKLEQSGYAIIENVIPTSVIEDVIHAIDSIDAANVVKSKNDSTYGIRDILSQAPSIKEFATSNLITKILSPLFGSPASLVKGMYFNKTTEANWKVPYHQDLTIAVKSKHTITDFGPWSKKAGIWHVQPNIDVLENITAVRCHLDNVSAENGALRVILGSHLRGKISPESLSNIKTQHKEVMCSAPKGSIMLMKPLLLHASSQGNKPSNRRILHFEYASTDLPEELEWYERYAL